mmetsp:Transcript_71973/g.199548  ORF Transcript_71973/g.199548 Transcript_71973/m.199548 type:complete len:347 (-) Transcript_71973:152-1192(-)
MASAARSLNPSASMSCAGGPHLVPLGRLADDLLRREVGDDAQEDDEDRDEGLVLVLVVEGDVEDHDEVDHQHRARLADVLQHRVQDRQQVHRAPALHGEGDQRRHGHGLPLVEDAVADRVRLDEHEHGEGDGPDHLELHELHVDRLGLVVLHVLVREHGAEAGHNNLEHGHERAEGRAAALRGLPGRVPLELPVAVEEVAHDRVAAQGQHEEHEEDPLQRALLLPLEAIQHAGGDEELGLAQDLVGRAAQAAEALQLEVVAECVEEANDGEDAHRLRIPNRLPLLEAAVHQRHGLGDDKSEDALHQRHCDRLVRGLAADLRLPDDQRVDGARQREEAEEADLQQHR